ncbi:MAG: anti-sigma F factor [Eubacterium sp.]
MYNNKFSMKFDSKSENEALARISAASFVTGLDPTLEELADIKTAVSEAVTNAIIHGYDGMDGTVLMEGEIKGKEITITIKDEGIGIEDIEKAKEPLFTTKPEMERSGMGFIFMEVFMDELNVISAPGEGTTVIMKKTIGRITD